MSLRTVELRALFSNQVKQRVPQMKNPDRNLDPGF